LAMPVDDPWLIREDGIIDDVAVDLAVKGHLPKYSVLDGSPVRLSRRERRLAAARILLLGGTHKTIQKHLHLPYRAAVQLAYRTRIEGAAVA
jgi:hypothetical protein